MVSGPARSSGLFGTLVVKLPVLVGRLTVMVVGIWFARRRAVRVFRTALRDMDLPPHVVRELVREYPRFNPFDYSPTGGGPFKDGHFPGPSRAFGTTSAPRAERRRRRSTDTV